jgi:hypothetical protein
MVAECTAIQSSVIGNLNQIDVREYINTSRSINSYLFCLMRIWASRACQKLISNVNIFERRILLKFPYSLKTVMEVE